MTDLSLTSSRRRFLAGSATLGLGYVLLGSTTLRAASTTRFTLPDLPYAPDALEPFIDTQTMSIHHGKHHAGYTRKLNLATESNPLPTDVSQLLGAVQSLPGSLRITVRNNGGGYANHNLFWEVMAPASSSGMPSPKLTARIDADFGSLDGFKETFANAAATRFGSGWAWLIQRPDGSLKVTSTPNQDSPLMAGIVPDDEFGTPLLGLDVWEHAYYLKYQNRRTEYIANWWNVVNWANVSDRLRS